MKQRDIAAGRSAADRYVALGDSYTIGEGVAPGERWPDVLVERLRDAGLPIDLMANPSVTGWTSAQLIEYELPILEMSDATFVTLLIGVNDWVQGVARDVFNDRLRTILDRIQAILPDPRKVILITIPDFSVTPQGATYSRGRDITAGIAGFNALIIDEGVARGLPVVDIFPLSRALVSHEFVGDDGLHPSGAAYARWVDLVLPEALLLLSRD